MQYNILMRMLNLNTLLSIFRNHNPSGAKAKQITHTFHPPLFVVLPLLLVLPSPWLDGASPSTSLCTLLPQNFYSFCQMSLQNLALQWQRQPSASDLHHSEATLSIKQYCPKSTE